MHSIVKVIFRWHFVSIDIVFSAFAAPWSAATLLETLGYRAANVMLSDVMNAVTRYDRMS
jgi:hypothetical protein